MICVLVRILVVYKDVTAFISDLTAEGVLDSDIAKSFSKEFLSGPVSFTQFVNLETVGLDAKDVSFEIIRRSCYYVHVFVRGVALILPAGSKGAHLFVPVLKSDNTMGHIII